MTYEIVEIIISVLGFIGIIISIYYTRKQILAQHDWNRRNEAINYTLKVGTDLQVLESFSALEKAFNYIDDIETISLKDLDSKFNKTPNLRNHIILKLNCMEILAIGVINRVYDNKIIKEAWEESFKRTDNKFRHFIKKRQEIDPNYCKNMQTLLSEWTNTTKANRNKTA